MSGPSRFILRFIGGHAPQVEPCTATRLDEQQEVPQCFLRARAELSARDAALRSVGRERPARSVQQHAHVGLGELERRYALARGVLDQVAQHEHRALRGSQRFECDDVTR